MILQLLVDLAAAADDTRRFAVIAGANDGGPGRIELRYAADDARAFASVLGALGGVSDADTQVLVEPSRDDLRVAITDLGARVAAAETHGDRTEVFVYYSGHSDETGLLLSGQRYEYADLRAEIDAIGADVKLVVLDSCASGAMLRGKGGVVRPAFLTDETVAVSGFAYLTSSSEDEVAQESDKIGGSFFTHFLVTGLRGAADYTKDGRVSLNEAYQYAYVETLARTERTQGGAQHPRQEIRVAGSGDLVLTDLSATRAVLLLGDDLDGRLYVRDSRGKLVAELAKARGSEVALGLGVGVYSATLDQDGVLYEATLELRDDETLTSSFADFHRVAGELARARGDGRHVWGNVGVWPGVEFPRLTDDSVVHSSLSIGVSATPALDGAAIALIGTLAAEDSRGVQISDGFAAAAHDFTGLQLTPGVNVVGDRLVGAQITAGVNVAEDVRGVQIGSVNVATEAHGAQIGLVNIAGKGKGLQLGVLNIADDYDGVPIGLLTIHRKGYNHVFAYGSDTEPVGLGATWGGKRIYTLAQAGWHPADVGPGYVATLGIGRHFPLGPVYLDADLSGGIVQDVADWDAGVLTRGRLTVGAGFKRLAVFGGPTFTVMPYGWGRVTTPTVLPMMNVAGVPVWAGATAGVRF